MELATAIFIAGIANWLILVLLRSRYSAGDFRAVALIYIGAVVVRYMLATFLWFQHGNVQFVDTFWGDSGTYDALGSAVARGWSDGATFGSWKETIEGRANLGFVYFVATVYYLFGSNTLLMQLLNGIIGSLTSVVIFEIGLLLYDRRVAIRAMLLTAFFPQMVFWSAAIYKDPTVGLCIALSMWGILRLRRGFRILPLVVYLAATAALVWLRFYVFYAVAAATLVGFFLGRRKGLVAGLVAQVGLVTSLLLVLLLTSAGKEMMAQSRFLDLEQLQASRSDLAARASSGFAVDADVSTPAGLIRVLPVGVSYLLFAPFPWMVGSLRQVLALPDVLAWYALMPALIRGLGLTIRHRLGQTVPILVFTSALTIAYGAFLGNAGTAYRQRTQVMMFYFLFIADGMKKGPLREDVKEAESARSEPLPS